MNMVVHGIQIAPNKNPVHSHVNEEGYESKKLLMDTKYKSRMISV